MARSRSLFLLQYLFFCRSISTYLSPFLRLSPFLSLYLPIYVSGSLPPSLSICLTFAVPISVPLYFYSSLRLSLPFLSLPPSLFITLPLSLPPPPHPSLSISISVSLTSMCVPIEVSLHPVTICHL